MQVKKNLSLVLCPFSCSKFSSKTGRILLDIVHERYLRQTQLRMMNKCEDFKYVIWARDEYIRLAWEYDCW